MDYPFSDCTPEDAYRLGLEAGEKEQATRIVFLEASLKDQKRLMARICALLDALKALEENGDLYCDMNHERDCPKCRAYDLVKQGVKRG